jgi:hypothetical protein
MYANNAVDPRTGGPSGRSLSGFLSAEMTTSLTLARIADGTSNTFMLATRYAECGDPVVTTHYSASPIGTILAADGPVPSTGVPSGQFAGAFFGAGLHYRVADSRSAEAIFQIAPKVRECIPDAAVFGHSFHAEAISIAMADATVMSIDPTFTPTRFCRALCPGDGFPLFDDWQGD